MKLMYLFSIMLLCLSIYGRNIEQLDSSDQDAIEMLESFRWKPELSKQELSIVANALTSSKDKVAKAALSVVVLHNVPEMKEMLQRGVGPVDGYSRLLASVISHGLEEEESAVETLLDQKVLMQVNKDAREEVIKMANHIIAIYVARMRRNGGNPLINLDKLQFSSVDQKLLKYSAMPSEKVKRDIVRQLGRATVAGADEYDLIEILASYKEVGVDIVLDTFQDEKTGVYGKVLLLSYLESQVSRMTDDERLKTKSVLSKNEIRNDKVNRALERLKEQLNE